MTNRVARAAPYACVALAACSWGTWPFFLRRIEASRPLPSALESAIVMAVITLVSLVAMSRDRTPNRVPRRAREYLVWLGFADALSVMLFFSAYKYTVAEAVVTHYLMPVFVALAAPFLLREKIARRTVLAIGLSFLGLIVMLARANAPSMIGTVLVSAGLGTASAFFYAATVIGNKLVATWYTTSESMFWHGLVSTGLLAALVPHAAWTSVEPRSVGLLVMVSFGPGALAGLVFVWGLRRMPAAHASTLTLLEPLVAVLIGAAFLHEKLGAQAAFGGALILGGAVMVLAQPRESPGSGMAPRTGAESIDGGAGGG